VSPDTVWRRDRSSCHLIFGPNGLKNRPRKPRNPTTGFSNYLFRASLMAKLGGCASQSMTGRDWRQAFGISNRQLW
jgi:hypothetical protein